MACRCRVKVSWQTRNVVNVTPMVTMMRVASVAMIGSFSEDLVISVQGGRRARTPPLPAGCGRRLFACARYVHEASCRRFAGWRVSAHASNHSEEFSWTSLKSSYSPLPIKKASTG